MGLRGNAIATEVVSPILRVDKVAGNQRGKRVVLKLVCGSLVKSELLEGVGSLSDLAPFLVWKTRRDTHDTHYPSRTSTHNVDTDSLYHGVMLGHAGTVRSW
jgi:hypothetical protein